MPHVVNSISARAKVKSGAGWSLQVTCALVTTTPLTNLKDSAAYTAPLLFFAPTHTDFGRKFPVFSQTWTASKAASKTYPSSGRLRSSIALSGRGTPQVWEMASVEVIISVKWIERGPFGRARKDDLRSRLGWEEDSSVSQPWSAS